LTKVITEHKDSHENTDNVAIAAFLKQSKVSGMKLQTLRISLSEIFRFVPTEQFLLEF
jgi:hypothetical protein